MANTENRTTLAVCLNEESRAIIAKAAELRGVSINDYVRMVTVAQARREVDDMEQNTIVLSAEEQLEFWNALAESPRLTKAQQELGTIMRDEQ